jgi:hypothetical protein
MIVAFSSPALSQGHGGIDDCFTCHFFEGFPPNLNWVKTDILTPNSGSRGVVYLNPTGQNSLADGDEIYDGPCEVCHTETAYHLNEGGGTSHFDGQACTVCHDHWPKEGDYFAPQVTGPESHATHLHAKKGPHIKKCTKCHDSENFGLFRDGLGITKTTVCDRCHSPEGPFDGVEDPTFGAKAGWRKGVYKTDGTELKGNKADWCATCHDGGVSVVKGVPAPNIMGDGLTYGYNLTGHGAETINAPCGACHTVDSRHTDGNQRTYEAESENYQKGYRLLLPMDIPRVGQYGKKAFDLCFAACHTYKSVVGSATNFRDDGRALNYHALHLDERFALVSCWDSDWNGTDDSGISCTACHNVHGSQTPVMTRHGELISTPDTEDKVPALDFKWYVLDASTETTVRTESAFGSLVCGEFMNLSYNNVCYGCHTAGRITYERSPESPGPEEPIRIDRVWTADYAGDDKSTFLPGDEMRVYVRFDVTGVDRYVTARGKVFDPSNDQWDIPCGRKKTKSDGRFTWHWDKLVPENATATSEAKVRMTLQASESDLPESEVLGRDNEKITVTIVAP